MAMKVKGLYGIIKKLKKYEAEFSTDVKEIVEVVLGDIENNARINAPGPGEDLITQFGDISQNEILNRKKWKSVSQAITYKVNPNGYRGVVQVDNSAGDLAAWIEFGTGQDATAYLATVEPEWKELAQKYYINGKGTILSQPFLYPAYLKGRIELIKELKALIKSKEI